MRFESFFMLITDQPFFFASSYSGPAVNTGLAQPFVKYNMAHGWYLTTSPIITVNWLAAPGQQWTVPVGGGFGRVFRVGDRP
jgi:hypothetical protein